MDEEVSVREILLSLFSCNPDINYSVREIETIVVGTAIELIANGISVNIEYRRRGIKSYASVDVTYELNLLRSMDIVEIKKGNVKYIGEVDNG